MDIAQTPPSNLEMEQAVIGVAITFPEKVAQIINEIGDDDDFFYGRETATIWDAIVEAHRDGRPADLVILVEILKRRGKLDDIGGSVALTKYIDIGFQESQLLHYLDVLREKSVLRMLIREGTRVVGLAYNKDAKPAQLLGEYQHRLQLLFTHVGGKLDAKEDLSKTIQDVILEYERDTGEDFRVGFPTIDNAMGGFRRGEMILITGRPGSGKTWLLLNMMQHMIRNYKVMLVSGELKERELMAKLTCSYVKLDYRNGYRNKGFKDADIARFLHGMEEIKHLDIDIIPFSEQNKTLTSLAARALQWKPDVLAVDGISLFSPSGGDKKEGWQYYTAISRELKAIAMEANCVVMATHWLSKSTEHKGLNRMAYADAYAQDASMVIGLEDETLQNGSRAKLYKARDSEANKVFELSCDFGQSLVREAVDSSIGIDLDDLRDIF